LNLLNPDFKLVGAAIGPHSTYKHACVMDFAGGARALADVVRVDTLVRCQGELSAEVERVITSVPGDADQLLADIRSELAKGAEVRLPL
jgi:hypothetical protein